MKESEVQVSEPRKKLDYGCWKKILSGYCKRNEIALIVICGVMCTEEMIRMPWLQSGWLCHDIDERSDNCNKLLLDFT